MTAPFYIPTRNTQYHFCVFWLPLFLCFFLPDICFRKLALTAKWRKLKVRKLSQQYRQKMMMTWTRAEMVATKKKSTDLRDISNIRIVAVLPLIIYSFHEVFLNACDFRNREDRNEQQSYGPCPLSTHSLVGETDMKKTITHVEVMVERSSNGQRVTGGADQVWQPGKLPRGQEGCWMRGQR